MTDMILVVEDEKKLADALCEYLSHQQFATHAIHHGDEVIDWVTQNNPALILLDLMLPGKDGVTICKEIRANSNIPIIMVTARTDEIDRLIGLEVGADDYLCKPYSLREVVARVKAVLRRSTTSSEPSSTLKLKVNKANYHISFEDNTAVLTAIEFKLLAVLSDNAGRIYSRDQLADKVYDDHRIVSDRTIDSHIKKLRKKLANISPDIQFIHSIYGVGYKYDV